MISISNSIYCLILVLSSYTCTSIVSALQFGSLLLMKCNILLHISYRILYLKEYSFLKKSLFSAVQTKSYCLDVGLLEECWPMNEVWPLRCVWRHHFGLSLMMTNSYSIMKSALLVNAGEWNIQHLLTGSLGKMLMAKPSNQTVACSQKVQDNNLD